MSTPLHAFHISDLSVSSDLYLPGAIETEPMATPDVVIASGTVPDRIDQATAQGPNWSLSDGVFLLEVPNIVRMLICDGATLIYSLAAGASLDDAAVFVGGTGIGILLQQRGRVVLHASAVQVGEKAIVFAGPSGAGKSTMAAALVAKGNALLCDDICVISYTTGQALAHPDGRMLKLWANSIDRLELAERKVAAMRHKLEKFYVEPSSVSPRALPVAAIYILREARLPGEAGIVEVNIADAARLVRDNAYRPALVLPMEQSSLYLRVAASITAAAGVFILKRPLDFKVIDESLASIGEHLRHTGIAELAL